MPTITPALIPTKAVGNLFSSLTGGDPSLNIRWLQGTEPVFYEVLNRPIADVAVRQLVLAKALDVLNISIGHQSLFPFRIQPSVKYDSTATIDIPAGMIWDMSVSLPDKWQSVRLAEIQRISGDNNTTSGSYSGILRFIFSAVQETDPTETYLFYADYQIESQLYFQPTRVGVVNSNIITPAINASEALTIGGFVNFRTLDVTDSLVIAFLEALAPPSGSTVTSGTYATPASYEIVDTVAGGTFVTEDFSLSVESHGTGMLTDSALNSIPAVNSDIQTWITSFNYPFASNASLISADDTVRAATDTSIPQGLFKEFNIIAPGGDGAIDDVSNTYYPIFLSRVSLVTNPERLLRFYFSSNTISSGGLSVFQVVATLDLKSSFIKDQVVPITPVLNGSAENNEIGRGHVVLSDLWTGTSSVITDFFNKFDLLPLSDLTFSRSASRLSSYAVSRVSKFTPTSGQSQALVGTTSSWQTPVVPGSSNRFVSEQDQGLGDSVDFDLVTTLTPNSAIERVGYKGALNHRIVKLVVDSTQVPNSDTLFYTNNILPRLTILLGRAPIFGDGWYNGVRFMFFNGDTWQG